MNDNFFVYLLGRRWPMMLVVLVGTVFAIIRWKRHPKVSAFAIAGLLLFQIQSLAFSSMYYKLPDLANRAFPSRRQQECGREHAPNQERRDPRTGERARRQRDETQWQQERRHHYEGPQEEPNRTALSREPQHYIKKADRDEGDR